MRYKVSQQEVFSLWANQSQEHAEQKGGGRTYFEGKTVYSYGSHFPIAKILRDGKHVLFTLQTYSNTTAKHINYARRAIQEAGLDIIYAFSIKSTEDSLAYWKEGIEGKMKEIQNPKNRKFEGRTATLKQYAAQLRKYIDFFKVELPFKDITTLTFIENTSTANIVAELRDEPTSYQFSELSEAAKRKAIEQHADINVDYDWWQWTYDDAASIGVTITGFDLGRRRDISGELLWSADRVAEAIIKEHGEESDTYKAATAFLAEVTVKQVKQKLLEHDEDIQSEMENEIEELAEEFKKDILQAYYKILDESYDYLQTDESIIETIEANDYEFDKEGNRN